MKFFGQKTIYLDHSAKTPVERRVLDLFTKTSRCLFANPSSIHQAGVVASELISKAREDVARTFSVPEKGVIFTSTATESINLAILGIKKLHNISNPNFITTKIEHSAVLSAIEKAKEEQGGEIRFVEVNEKGIVDLKNLAELIDENTVLISIGYVNNEIGTTQDIKEIAHTIRKAKFKIYNSRTNLLPIFHTDATQAVLYEDLFVPRLGVDMLSFNGTKIYAPGGGVLVLRKELDIDPIFSGGGQEFGLRSGTSSLAQIVSIALALKISEEKKETETKRLLDLKNYFKNEIKKLKEFDHFTGDEENRIPSHLSVCFSGISSDLLVLSLSRYGIYVSGRSACKEGEEGDSHVLRAIGETDFDNKAFVRFSFGRSTRKKDLEKTIKVLKKVFSIQSKLK